MNLHKEKKGKKEKKKRASELHTCESAQKKRKKKKIKRASELHTSAQSAQRNAHTFLHSKNTHLLARGQENDGLCVQVCLDKRPQRVHFLRGAHNGIRLLQF